MAPGAWSSAARAVCGVYAAGREVVRDGAPLPALGRSHAGSLLAPVFSARDRKTVLARYRNRIDDQTFDHPFRNYWEVFVFKHQQPRNVAMHCAAVLLMYAAVIGLAATLNPWWLALLLFSQLFGLAGHLLFERNHVDTRDAVFSWRASLCLNRLLFEVASGRYWREVGRVRTLFAAYRGFA